MHASTSIIRLFSAGLFAVGNALAQTTSPPAAYALCLACHGADGKGIGAGTAKMAPPLAGSALATAGDGELLASIVFTGIAKTDANYTGMMVPLGAAMKDSDLAALLTYIRSGFGNKASAVTDAQVKSWRQKYEGKPMQKRADLEKHTKGEAAGANDGASQQPASAE